MTSLESKAVEKMTPEPVRILVETKTHLVPGDQYDYYWRKRDNMLNIICQFHWNCDWNPQQHRYQSYNDYFALPNRRCFFLIDYGPLIDHNAEIPPRDIPTLSYKWTGEMLVPKPKLAKSQSMQDILEKWYPFKSRRKRPKDGRELSKREDIRDQLYQDVPISEKDCSYIREHTEDARWLQDCLEPRFWSLIEDGLQRLEEREKRGYTEAERISQSLKAGESLQSADFIYIREHRDDARWFKSSLPPRLWSKVEHGLQLVENQPGAL